jgi:hypothetical protein
VAASAFAVESANVVGYTQVTCPAGQQFIMLGVPFDCPTNVVDGFAMDDLFPDAIHNGFKGGTGTTTADYLQFWTGSDYAVLYLYDSTSTGAAAKRRKGHWINPGVLPDASWGTRGEPTQHKVKPGDAFWLMRNSAENAATYTFAGQVVAAQSGTKTRTLSTGFNLIAGSFSSPFIPNPDKATNPNTNQPYGEKIDWIAKGCQGGTGISTADYLQFWTGSDYAVLYLYDSTSTGAAAMRRKGYWLNPGVLPDASWGTRGEPSAVVLPAGVGFWYMRQESAGSLEITIDQPYTL